jgi:hypothetical protein
MYLRSAKVEVPLPHSLDVSFTSSIAMLTKFKPMGAAPLAYTQIIPNGTPIPTHNFCCGYIIDRTIREVGSNNDIVAGE